MGRNNCQKNIGKCSWLPRMTRSKHASSHPQINKPLIPLSTHRPRPGTSPHPPDEPAFSIAIGDPGEPQKPRPRVAGTCPGVICGTPSRKAQTGIIHFWSPPLIGECLGRLGAATLRPPFSLWWSLWIRLFRDPCRARPSCLFLSRSPSNFSPVSSPPRRPHSRFFAPPASTAPIIPNNYLLRHVRSDKPSCPFQCLLLVNSIAFQQPLTTTYTLT
ncbi:hypothetical protein QBC39DRAFT_65229 [Podospora conica]|nr:hypothetical protein QBC39DRAFT_65229 [Schizothecium conicum]